MEKIFRPDSLIWKGYVSKDSQGVYNEDTYQLVSLLHVGTLETGNDGSAQTHLLHDVDQTLGDGVAADDTTEDVDEDGRHLGVAGDQLESALDGSGSGTTTNVKEVSGGTAV